MYQSICMQSFDGWYFCISPRQVKIILKGNILFIRVLQINNNVFVDSGDGATNAQKHYQSQVKSFIHKRSHFTSSLPNKSYCVPHIAASPVNKKLNIIITHPTVMAV